MTTITATTAALRLTIEGELTAIELERAEEGSILKALYRAIDTRVVEVLQLDQSITMWLDEEGMYAAEPNPIATALARTFGFIWQNYHGIVVFTGGVDDEGNTLPLDPTARDRIEAAIADVIGA